MAVKYVGFEVDTKGTLLVLGRSKGPQRAQCPPRTLLLSSDLHIDYWKQLKSTYPILTDLNGKEYEDTDGCSYGESDTSNWEYHPEHVDGEVRLMVDKVLEVCRRTQSNGHWKISTYILILRRLQTIRLLENTSRDYWRVLMEITSGDY